MTALLAAASTAILNSLGRIAAFLFSWAMVGFFGKMPPKRQYMLAGIALMSVLWAVFFASMFYPQISQFLFLLNKNLGEPRIKTLIARFSIALVLGLPLLIGLASLFVDNKPPETLGGKVGQVFKGYIIAPGFAVGMILMMITSVIGIAVTYLKRLQVQHVPIKLKENGYDIVLHDVRDALNKHDMPVRETELAWYLKPPVMVMSLLAKSIVQGLVTPGERMLTGDSGLTVVVHPTDMVISAPKSIAAEARAIITQRVPFTEAYLTWEEETQKLEDKITSLWRKWRDEPHGGEEQVRERLKLIEDIKEKLHTQNVPFEQWEVVYREALQLQDEVISGRVQRGEAPAASSKADVDSKESALGAAKSSDQVKPARAGEASAGNPAWTDLVIIGLLVTMLAKWKSGRDRNEMLHQ